MGLLVAVVTYTMVWLKIAQLNQHRIYECVQQKVIGKVAISLPSGNVKRSREVPSSLGSHRCSSSSGRVAEGFKAASLDPT